MLKRVRPRNGFWRNAAANSTMAFAVSLPALLGAAGVATDYAVYNLKLSQLQAAADEAAIAAVKEISVSTTSAANVQQAAKSFAFASLNAGARNISITASADIANSSVNVKLTEAWAPFFAHFLGVKITPVVAQATAQLQGRANTCVLTLDGAASASFELKANGSLTANECATFTNSMAADALSVGNGSKLKAEQVCTSGGYKNSGTIIPGATTDCPPLADPLAARVAPAITACVKGSSKFSSGSVTLSPGNYCNGIDIGGTAVVTFQPGNYVIGDAPFRVGGNAKVSGSHVGFYLKGKDAVLNFNGNATIDLTGSTDAEMAGLLFFEDRAAPLGRNHLISANRARTLTGTIYLPRGNLLVDGGSKVADGSAYTAIIAQNVLVRNGPELVLNSDYGATDVPVPAGVRSTQQVVITK